MTCRERELTLDHIHTFLKTQGHGGPPQMSDQFNTGPPRRQHKQERRYTPSTHPFILTRRKRNDNHDGQMIFGDLVSLKLPEICLRGDEKPRKNITQETCPDRGSNLDPLHDGHACYRLLHSGGPNIN